MTIQELLDQVRANAQKKVDERNKNADELAELRSAGTTDEARVNELREANEKIDGELTQFRAEIARYEAEIASNANAQEFARDLGKKYDQVARIQREERTYTAEKSAAGITSFIRDAYAYKAKDDLKARERLERHAVEVEREGELTERATTTGSFAGLVVPQYLVEQAALIARAGRPFANTVRSLQIPEQGIQFLIPQGTTGAAVASQNGENTAVQSTDEVWANVTVNVATVAGQQDISRQSLERGTPGIDSLIYADLAGAYAAELDRQCLNGSGSSGQMLGMFQTSGINAATAFGAAVTPANVWLKTAGQVQAILANRFMAADYIVVSPRRFGWLLGQVDSSNRPLLVPTGAGPTNAQGTFDTPTYGVSAYTWMGLPVVVDANVPSAVGTNSEDLIGIYRSADQLLWEDGDGMPRELRFEQTLGGQLTVKLVVYGYAAFTSGRYPKSVGKVGGLDTAAGNGLIAPTF